MYQRQATQDIVLMLMLQYACLWILGQLQQQPQLLSFSSIGFAASLSGWEHYSCRTCFSISALVIKIYQSQVVIASLEQAFIHIQCIRMHYRLLRLYIYMYVYIYIYTFKSMTSPAFDPPPFRNCHTFSGQNVVIGSTHVHLQVW